MTENKFNIKDTILAVDINEATQAVKENRFKDAIKLLEINLIEHPDHIDSLYLAGVCSRYLKEFDDAIKYIESLLVHAPDMGRAYQELAHINRDMGNEEKSISNYRQACELNPALISSWMSLYEYFKKNNNKPALDHATEQINKLKSLPNMLLYIDQVMNEGRLGVAELKCREFLKKNPTHTYAMSQLSEIANRLGHFDDAELLLEKAVKFNPNDGELRMKYALVLRKKQKFAETMEQVNILCDKYPDNLAYQAQKASEIMQNGQHEDAIDLFDDILNKNPHNFSTYTSKGHALKTLGKTNDAIESYQSAYKIRPDHGEAFFSLANLKTYSFSDPEFTNMKEQIKRVDLSLRDKAYFHFALAQGYESNQQYDEAFFHLKSGNQIKRDQSKYSIERMDNELQAQIDVCNEEFFKNLDMGGHHTKDPIFILGLPRAGSTLIEQILASHSMIDGTLELPNILSLAQSLRGGDIYGKLGNYPKSMGSLSLDQRVDMGRKFIEDTQMHRGSAPMFTDKMPNNFRLIGFILSALPKAKIIHVKRDARATCWSNYKHYFTDENGFTYNQKDLVQFYTLYSELMDFWLTLYPNKIYNICYEDLTTNQEPETRKLLDYCELEWDDNCLNFHKNKRAVLTASSSQVRQKMYQGSSEAWKKYENYLQPLIEGLKSY